MRWTRQRARRTRPEAYGEVVSFWHPDAGVKLAEATPLTTVSIKRGHRGEHEVSRKTIARGMPVESVCPVVTMLVCLFLSHARLRVQRAPGIPCALSSLGETVPAQLGRPAPRECEAVFEIMPVIARSESDEAIHSYFAAKWIASLALAMTT